MNTREIKFRGNAINATESWVYGNLLILTDSETEKTKYYIRNWDSNAEVDPKSIGQLTGLNDKKSTPIYEGDILQFVSSNLSGYREEWDHEKYGSTPINSAMVWNNEIAAFRMKFKSRFNIGVQDCEIIGNIYETPELLTPSTTQP